MQSNESGNDDDAPSVQPRILILKMLGPMGITILKGIRSQSRGSTTSRINAKTSS